MTRSLLQIVAAVSLCAVSLSACGSNESAAAPNQATTQATVKAGGSAAAADSAKWAALLPPLSGDDVWTMDAGQSALTFEAYYNGDFTGEFTRFQTAIKLDPNALETAEIHAAIDLSSVAAKSEDVTYNLRTKDWFHTALHPYAIFTSTDVSRVSSEAYLAAGNLTIKGISNPAELSFTLLIDGDSAQAKGSTTLSRKSYNVGEGSDFEGEDWVKFPVKVNVDIKAHK